MTSYKHGKDFFNFRVAGVIIKDGKVLFQRATSDDFWALPGGRVEMLETTSQTLVREMEEEIGVKVEIKRLLFVVENFFDWENTKAHELGFYYLITVPHNSKLMQTEEPFNSIDNETQLAFNWLSIDKLVELPIYPVFLRKALKDLPTCIMHVINKEE